MEEIITGYQYGPINGEFRGVYEFPNNLDKEEIHMPPYTTLIPPPEEIPAGKIACWNGDVWELKDDQVSIKSDPIKDDDIGKLLPEFVADQIRFGLWSDELQQKYDIARPLYLQKEQNDIDAIKQKAIQDAQAIKQMVLARRAAEANTANNINL